METQVKQGLERALDSMEDAYAEVKADSEGAVTEWRWATGKYYSLVPFEPERFGIRRGSLLPKPPAAPKNAYAFGFDAQGLLRVLRGHGGDGKPDIEQFTQVNDDGRLLVRGYLNRGRIAGQAVYIERDEAGRPLRSATLGMEGDWREETYVRSQGTLERIEMTRFDSASERTFSKTLELEYEVDGSVSGSYVDPNGHREQVFKGVADRSL